MKWEVEVSLLQINLCSDTAAGRFLLAAHKCQLSGSMLPASQRKALCIEMQVGANTTFLPDEGDMHPAGSRFPDFCILWAHVKGTVCSQRN